MPSAFGWLDTDSEQRSKMLEVVELFKEDRTLDELGIGSIRDALADSMELHHGAHSHNPSWPLAGLDREYGLGSRSTQCQ